MIEIVGEVLKFKKNFLYLVLREKAITIWKAMFFKRKSQIWRSWQVLITNFIIHFAHK